MKITGVWSVSVCCKAGYSYVCACGVAHLWLRSGLPYIWRYYLSKAIVVWCRSRASSACRLNCCLCFWYAKLCTVYQRCDACCFPPITLRALFWGCIFRFMARPFSAHTNSNIVFRHLRKTRQWGSATETVIANAFWALVSYILIENYAYATLVAECILCARRLCIRNYLS